MDIDIHSGKPKVKQNIKVNERIVRTENIFYIPSIDN